MRNSYLLYGVELWVVEVPEEPEDPWSEDFSEEKDERGEVEHVHHPHQPVDEHGGPGSRMETVLSILECRIKHGLSIEGSM